MHKCAHFFPRPVRHYCGDMFARKSIEELKDASSDAGLKKRLNYVDLTFLGIGCIIGSGIFVLTGQAAGSNAGPAVVISFLIGGVCSGLAALCYSEMASMIPVAGSAYTYSYATCGEFLAWIIGWNLILEYLVGAATVSVGWSAYVTSFINDVSGYNDTVDMRWATAPFAFDDASQSFYMSGGYINLPAIVIVTGLTLLLISGVKESAMFNGIIVVIKTIVVLIFVFASIKWINTDNWDPFIPPEQSFGHYGWSGILQATTIVFFSYIGFDAVSTTAQECVKPQRDLPIGIIASLIICTILYIAVCLALTGLVPYYTLIGEASPISFAAEQVGQRWLAITTEIGAIAGTTSVMLVNLMSQPRVFYSMARDGLFPNWIAKTHGRFGTPWVTTVITGTIAAVLGGLLPINILSELTSVGTLTAFMLVSLSVMILRLKRPDFPRKFRVPLGPFIIPILSFLCSAALIVFSTTATKIRLVVWIAIGIVLYVIYGKQHSVLQKKLKARRRQKAMESYADSCGQRTSSSLGKDNRNGVDDIPEDHGKKEIPTVSDYCDSTDQVRF